MYKHRIKHAHSHIRTTAGLLMALALPILGSACDNESSEPRAAQELKLSPFGVNAIVADGPGYRLLDPAGQEIGYVDIAVADASGSLRVQVADHTAELTWTGDAATSACNGVPMDTQEAVTAGIGDPDNCGAALAIASEIIKADALPVPWSFETHENDIAFRNAPIEYMGGCVSWSAEIGCTAFQHCYVFTESGTYSCHTNYCSPCS